MNFLKNIISSKKTLIYLFFVFVHFLFVNYNISEWGDSYRILRTSVLIREGKYPVDEKRPPLYPLVLATYPSGVDPILWGRYLIIFIGLITLYLFDKFLLKHLGDTKYNNLGLLLFAFGPVYFYWSLRLYADTFFLIFVILSMNILKSTDFEEKHSKWLILGFLTGISILTRFEGYILGLSVAIYMFTYDDKIFDINLSKKIERFLVFALGVLVFVLPFWYLRNPLNSAYIGEPGGRTYDLKMVVTYVVSLIFVMGIIPALFIFKKNLHNLFFTLKKNRHLTIYLVLASFLILLWPAAIPRLFLAILPIVVMLFVDALNLIDRDTLTFRDFLQALLCFAIYWVIQYFLRLQFLLVSSKHMVLVSFIQLFGILLYFIRFRKMGIKIIILGMFLWSYLTVLSHRDIYKTIWEAASYASENIHDSIAYNDVSGVSTWYLNYKPDRKNEYSFYYDINEPTEKLSTEYLKFLNANYLLSTNEHDLSMDVNFEKRPYLEEVARFENEVNGQIFFAIISKINLPQETQFNE